MALSRQAPPSPLAKKTRPKSDGWSRRQYYHAPRRMLCGVRQANETRIPGRDRRILGMPYLRLLMNLSEEQVSHRLMSACVIEKTGAAWVHHIVHARRLSPTGTPHSDQAPLP